MAASKCWVQMPSFEPTAGWGWALQAQVSHMQIRPLMSSPSEVVPTVPRTCWMETRVSSHTFILVTYNQTTCPGMHFELILKKNYLVPSIMIMHWIFFFFPHKDIDLLNLKHLKWATVSITLPWPWEGSATHLWSWLLGYESCAGLFVFPWYLTHSKPSNIFCFPSFIIVFLGVLFFFLSVRYEEIFKKRKHIWHIPIVLPNDCLY